MTNRIREIRKKKNMTMRQLGDIIGVRESTISQYETGKRQPDNETLLKLSEALSVTVGYLLGVDEIERPAVKTGSEPYNHLPPDEQQLLQGYRRLDEQDRNRIQERLATMLEAEKYSVKVGSRPA